MHLSQTVIIAAWISAAVTSVVLAEPAPSQITVKVLSRTTTPVLKADQPWESFCVNYATVIRVGDEWRMWYEAYDQDYKSDNDAYYCYATSKNGVTWAKPNLGLVEYKGSKNNNIILAARSSGGIGGATVFLDADARYKMCFVRMLRVPPNMSFGDDNPDWRLLGADSADGIHWQEQQNPLMSRLVDSQNVCFWDGDRYRLYCRMWRTDGHGGGDTRRRTVGYSESRTFGDFPRPIEILRGDEGDPDRMDFYNSASAKLRDDLYVMFPSAFLHDQDVAFPHVAVSRDGKSFIRINDRQSLLPPGNGFDSRSIYVCPGATPGEEPDTWWIYYLGRDFKHGEALPHRIKSRGGIGRALIEVKDLAREESD